MKENREYFEVNDTFVRTTVQKYRIPSVAALIGTTVTIVANSMFVGNYIGADVLTAVCLSHCGMPHLIWLSFAVSEAVTLLMVAANAAAKISIFCREKRYRPKSQ